jgi:predicted DNA-binding antitoxin AbrB/MazE fold protein
MIQHVNAIYEHGVLKPLGPLELSDQEVVSLAIETANSVRPEETGQTLYEIMDEAGLIGCIDDAPSDLSTNPKYMEGFGESGN